MPNLFSSIFQSRIARPVVKWFRSVRGAKSERPISPEEFLVAFTSMMNDPEQARLYRRALIGTVLPTEGATCTPAADVSNGKFGENCSYGDFLFDSSSKVGIGVAPSFPLDLRTTNAATSGNQVAFFGQMTANPPGNSSAAYLTSWFQLQTQADTGYDYTGVSLYGLSAQFYHNGTGQVSHAWTHSVWSQNVNEGHIEELHGIDVNGSNSSSGTIVTNRGIYVRDFGNPGGTLTNNYGIHVEPQSAGSSNRYDIYSPGKNSLLGGLNQIIFLRPSGGDDTNQIQDAIDKLQSYTPPGGIIYLTRGTFNISSRIDITVDGVKLRGYGGTWEGDDPLYGEDPGSVTLIQWTPTSPTSDDTMISMTSLDSDDFVQDLEISDLSIDGGGHAQVGLKLNRVMDSKFINFHVKNLRTRVSSSVYSTGMIMTTTATEDGVGTSWNLFQNCSVIGTAVGISLDGNNNGVHPANTCHNTFIGFNIRTYGSDSEDAGIHLLDCDNNTFYRTWIQLDSGQGHGLLIDDPIKARANYFYHFQGDFHLGVLVKNVSPPFTDPKNLIFGYDQANGQPEPVAHDSSSNPISAEYVLTWINSRGEGRGMPLVGSQPEAAPAPAGGGPSGNGATAAPILIAGGTGGNAATSPTTGKVAGNGSDVAVAAGDGGNAPSGSTNGSGGSISLQPGAPGSGGGNAGSYGKILIAPSGGKVCIGTATPSADVLTVSGRVSASSGYDGIIASDVPNLDASKITTGSFSTSRIPSLDASKITSGVFSASQIPAINTLSGVLADAQLPTDVIKSESGSAQKIAGGFLNISASSNTTVSTGLSSIAAVIVTPMNNSAYNYNTSGGSVTIYNDDSSSDYFQWIALGS